MTRTDVYYDPYDFLIDSDPYPVWRRLREERPLYYNEKYDFYALGRFDEVEKASVDWRTYSPAKGTLLELAVQARTSTVRGWERLPMITDGGAR